MSKKYYVIPIFVPHKGCPHDCIFCNQKKITGVTEDITSQIVESIIESHLGTIDKKCSTVEVAFFGGSFTAIPKEQQDELLKAAYKYLENNKIDAIRLSTRPDYISDDILINLKKFGVSIVELGVQSMDEEVLQRSCRGHSALDVINAIRLLKKYGFTVGVQVMIGLPGDSKEKCINTVKCLICEKPDIARIYPALVIKNTMMEELYYSGFYSPFSLEDTIQICKNIVILFEKNNITVIRIGLQPTENISLNGDIVAGPFHPSMRQLVYSSLYRDILEQCLLSSFSNEDNITIKCNSKELSNVIGQHRDNINYLEKKYFPIKISIKQDNDIKFGSLIVYNSKKQKYMTKDECFCNMVI